MFHTVIGRQGEMINRLQAESGARIQVAPGEILLEKYKSCMTTGLLGRKEEECCNFSFLLW